MEQSVETQLLDAIDGANGVFIYTASSGYHNTSVSVRLYLDDVSDDAVTDAVRTAFDVTWHQWDPQVSVIALEVREGPRPAEPKRLDNKIIDISAAAKALGMPGNDPYFKIIFDAPHLTSVFGESGH